MAILNSSSHSISVLFPSKEQMATRAQHAMSSKRNCGCGIAVALCFVIPRLVIFSESEPLSTCIDKYIEKGGKIEVQTVYYNLSKTVYP